MKMTAAAIHNSRQDELASRNDPDFESDIKVNANRLDWEWTRQPQLVWKYGKLASDAKDEVSRMENEISMLEADIASNVRAHPSIHGLSSEKVTDKNIRFAIEQDDEYQKLQRKLRIAKKNYDVLERAVTAIDHKKRSLEYLVKLLSMDYFSGPSVPYKINSEVREHLSEAPSRAFAERAMNRKH